VALITALLVVALAVTAAIGMSVRDQTQIQRTTLVFEQDLARSLLLGAEVMALRLLERWDESRTNCLGTSASRRRYHW
jgi:general secretion pathway protein K